MVATMGSPNGGNESDSNPEFVNVGNAVHNGTINQRFDRDNPNKAMSSGPFGHQRSKNEQN